MAVRGSQQLGERWLAFWNHQLYQLKNPRERKDPDRVWFLFLFAGKLVYGILGND